MPAMLDDPTSPAIYRVSGQQPFPEPYGQLPHEISPKQVILRDRTTTATLVPFSSPNQVPPHLTAYLCELLNREIEKGDTYPMLNGLALSSFAPYWFANFGAIMVVGDISSPEEVVRMEQEGVDWAKSCLGSFYIKPNYPGRSSHVCNGGFLVTDGARNRGVGRLMGEGYLEWAPKLGYTYSMFNLVYETNQASLRIWDALGFKRIGRVKGAGNLKSYPDTMIDAIIFGRELGGENEEYQSEERFDKIRYYLKTGSYPIGSDRAEKSRLRSAATHYRLITANGEEDKLMLKGKEVVSDPHKQYDIARAMHAQTHGGINKTTAGIAERYHWVRIKETVSAAIRNCAECKESLTPKQIGAMPPAAGGASGRRGPLPGLKKGATGPLRQIVTASPDLPMSSAVAGASSGGPTRPDHRLDRNDEQQISRQLGQELHQHAAPTAQMSGIVDYQDGSGAGYSDIGPVDPQLMWQHDHNMQIDGVDKTGVTEEEGEANLREALGVHAMSNEISSYLGDAAQRQSNH